MIFSLRMKSIKMNTMTREEIVREIIKRFKLDAVSVKSLERYEYELIYESLKETDKESIDRAIKDFIDKKFKMRVIRTAYVK